MKRDDGRPTTDDGPGSRLDLLVLTDLHYIHYADDVCTIPERRTDLGPAFMRAAFQDLQKTGVQPDALVLLGDLVNDGRASNADRDLADLAQAARDTGLPILALPGNHDGDAGSIASTFNCLPGLHEVGGCGFLIFHDHVAPDHVTTRPQESLSLPGQVSQSRPDLPLIALQHNPLYPPIEHEYPFIVSNADEILRGYHDAGVRLSLSGHYHPGQSARPHPGGTVYATLPAACEAPHPYGHVQIEGRDIQVRLRTFDV